VAARAPKKGEEAQRRALLGAMARLVAEGGYREVRTTALAREAHVSKNALYLHFAGKEGCFAALCEEIAEGAAARIAGACAGAGGGPEERLRAGLASLADLIEAEPAAARLLLVNAPELGAAGLDRRRRAAARLEAIVAGCLAAEGEAPPDALARAIVAGVAAVARRRLREGGTEPALPVEDLTGWAMDLAATEGEAPLRAALATRGRQPRRRKGEVPWSESPRSGRSRSELTRCERFARGAAWLAAGRGAPALSIPAVAYAAASSNEAFYRCFADTEEALLAAFEELRGRALAACREGPAPQPALAGRLAAALAALRGDLATGFFLPRLAFVELPALGPHGARHAEEALGSLAAVLAAPAPRLGPVPREARAGALWGLVEGALVRDAPV
jgi:AcrR family transcriptional regulator